jgi:hypothetical protein
MTTHKVTLAITCSGKGTATTLPNTYNFNLGHRTASQSSWCHRTTGIAIAAPAIPLIRVPTRM